jgi:transcriptional regulator with GAF, ATPase, and Fis domain
MGIFSWKNLIIFALHNQCCCPSNQVNITMALKRTGWKIYRTGGAAELLGLKPTTLLSCIKNGD